MDPLDTMTVTDWRRVYERSQEYATKLLGDLVEARRRESELVDRLRRRDEENRQLRGKLNEVDLVRAWTNEDGKSFVFTDDLLVAMGDITPDALSRAREIAGEET